MEIIFIRHEKAEEGHADLPDRERRLTQVGQEKAQEAVQKLVDYLKDVDTVADPEVGLVGNSVEAEIESTHPTTVIWTSPALRAQETAQPYVEALGGSAELHDFIYTGEYKKLRKAVEELPQSVETLIIFGHEPSLSKWIEKLTDETVKMKKGNRASVKLKRPFKQPLAGKYKGKI